MARIKRERLDDLTKAAVLVAAFGVLSLLANCLLISSKKYFWYDELLTWQLVTDPSLVHMLRALGDQVDNSPPFYYLLTRGWVRLAGASEWSLRLLSSLGICTAFVIAFSVTRRAFGFWAGALGATASFFLSSQVLLMNSEARNYGLFIALNALALLFYYRWSQKDFFSWKDFWANALIHGSLVLTHNFGLLYSGIFLLSFIVSSFYKKIFTPKAYASVILGWLAFLPWIPFVLHQAGTGRPHTWMEMPGYASLLNSFAADIAIGFFLIILFLSYLVLLPKNLPPDQATESENRETPPGFLPLLFLAILLILIPPSTAYAVSCVSMVIFFPRYFFPSTLGWSIFFAWLVWHLLPVAFSSGQNWRNMSPEGLRQAILAIFLGLILLFPVVHGLKKNPKVEPSISREYLSEDFPIVVGCAIISVRLTD
jgi:uncharacterized membrane protein